MEVCTHLLRFTLQFNRIPVAVLSVCSTQYKSVLDALRQRRERFAFEGTEIALRPSVMAFITMNPGYPGRAELPESLKVRLVHLQHWVQEPD